MSTVLLLMLLAIILNTLSVGTWVWVLFGFLCVFSVLKICLGTVFGVVNIGTKVLELGLELDKKKTK